MFTWRETTSSYDSSASLGRQVLTKGEGPVCTDRACLCDPWATPTFQPGEQKRSLGARLALFFFFFFLLSLTFPFRATCSSLTSLCRAPHRSVPGMAKDECFTTPLLLSNLSFLHTSPKSPDNSPYPTRREGRPRLPSRPTSSTLARTRVQEIPSAVRQLRN